MNRKNFLQHAALTAAGVVTMPLSSLADSPREAVDPLPAEKVKEFVIAGHGNSDKVKAMLTEMPTLLYATWDWGNGDFETALEGAGHVGNKEIANFLIVLTMLGKTILVKTYLDLYPQYITARGPHGLTLLHHAQKGGEDAKELLNYLQSKGLKEVKANL
jgi:hypothetical protein